MTATPIAMIEHCGHKLSDAKLVIQWHVVAMFAPSFFTGSLINYFGNLRVIGIGILFMFLSITIALLGTELIHFWLSMFFLGLGWNFMFVGGSTLLTYTYEVNETSKAQGFHDFVVFLFCRYIFYWLWCFIRNFWVEWSRFWSNTIDDIYSYNFFLCFVIY